MLPQASREL